MEEALHRTLVESLPLMVWRCDATGRADYVSSEWIDFTGLTMEQAIAAPPELLIHSEDLPAVRELWTEAANRREAYCAEFRFLRNDGEYRWVHAQASPVFSPQRELLHWVGTTTDIHDRRTTEEARALLAAIVEYSHDAIIGVGEGALVTSWNPAAERLYGYTAGEIIGRPIEAIFPPELAYEIPIFASRILAGERVEPYEAVRVRKDGTRIDVSSTISPVRNAAGEVIGSSTIARDVTPRQKIAQVSLQAQKMEAFGKLAAGVAHDFNNLLTTIMGFCELASTSLPDDHPAANAIEVIMRAGSEAAHLTRQMLAFSRQQRMRNVLVDLSEMVGSIESLLCRMVGDDVRLEVRTLTQFCPVVVDRAQMDHVVMNLVENANEATSRGRGSTVGRITIELGVEDFIEPWFAGERRLPAGLYAALQIADTGVGMSPETQERIFEPFFTTKDVGRGSGLGLATCYGIVEEFGGAILVESAVGQGTTVKVLIPLATEEEVARLAGTAATASQVCIVQDLRGSEVVLLVEDQTMVRALASHKLRSLGYMVYEAPTGADALMVAADIPEAIDILVTDLVMPEISGQELAQMLVESGRVRRILFMSGFQKGEEPLTLGDKWLEQGLADAADFLAKPFATLDLANMVRSVLDRNRS